MTHSTLIRPDPSCPNACSAQELRQHHLRKNDQT